MAKRNLASALGVAIALFAAVGGAAFLAWRRKAPLSHRYRMHWDSE